MKDLIDRHAAIDALHDEIVRRRINEDSNEDGDDGKLDEFDTEAILRRLPSAQPERKKGKWIKESLVTNYPYKCSACKKYTRAMYDFCPNCGADMRGEQE